MVGVENERGRRMTRTLEKINVMKQPFEFANSDQTWDDAATNGETKPIVVGCGETSIPAA